MQINTNIPALRAQTNLMRTDRKMGLAMQRLSSGLRINSVKDDSAGLAIVNKIKDQIKGMEMANKNSLDAISLVQTAEGALSQSHSIVQRIRELAVQSASDSNTSEDRKKIQLEIDQLTEELNSLTEKTDFNSLKPLSGAAGRMGLSRLNGTSAINIAGAVFISSNASPGKLSYNIESMGTPAKVMGSISSSVIFGESSFTVNGEKIEISAGDSADTVLEKLRDACGLWNIDVVTPDYPSGGSLMLINKDAGSKQYIDLQPPDSSALALLGLDPGKETGTDAVISGIIFTDDSGKPVQGLNNPSVIIDGNSVHLNGGGGQTLNFELKLSRADDGSFLLRNGTTVSDDGIINTGPINGMGIEITGFGPISIQIGANKGMEMEINIPNMNAKALGLNTLNLKTQEGAGDAISACDRALAVISDVRVTLGACENRLRYTISGLDASSLASEEARSRIEDTDMAQEMTNYTQLNILSQAAISILAQANQRPQQILQLIGR